MLDKVSVKGGVGGERVVHKKHVKNVVEWRAQFKQKIWLRRLVS